MTVARPFRDNGQADHVCCMQMRQAGHGSSETSYCPCIGRVRIGVQSMDTWAMLAGFMGTTSW